MPRRILALALVAACGDAPPAGVDAPPTGVDAPPAGVDAGSLTIWRPPPGTTWQWQLLGTIDTSVVAEMYDIDLFDAPPAVIDELRAAGRAVVCYFSAGSYEDWRPDAAEFPPSALGNDLDGWPGERWLDTRDAGVRAIMRARLDLAVAKRCDGVEPDNVDGYANDSGFPLTAATQLEYNRFLAAEAHARGLSVGLKNDAGQVPELVGDFDWALDEECVVWNECDAYAPFVAAGKAVFDAEYTDQGMSPATVCPVTGPLRFSSIVKRRELDAWRETCP